MRCILLRNLLLILLSINALSCGKKKEATPTTVDIGRRGANITAIPFVNYNGQIRIDAKGDKAIYLSGRNQTDESVKIWKWESTSAPQTSVLASTADFGSAHLAAISPDGGWISFVAVGADGKQTIYVQNFVNDKLFAQVTFDEYEKGVIERLSFSTNTNNSLPLLAIQYSRFIYGHHDNSHLGSTCPHNTSCSNFFFAGSMLDRGSGS